MHGINVVAASHEPEGAAGILPADQSEESTAGKMPAAPSPLSVISHSSFGFLSSFVIRHSLLHNTFEPGYDREANHPPVHCSERWHLLRAIPPASKFKPPR